MTTRERDTSDDALRECDVDTALFDALSDAHRRFVVSYLDERDEPVSVDALADELARRNADDQDDEVSEERRKSLYLALYHQHIPRLVDAGLVERDRETGAVSLAAEYEDISEA